MAENSSIEWCDHTFNPWTGCTKVSPGCANCYAEGWAKRSGLVQWGPGKPRRRTSAANWKEPVKWNRLAGFFGQCPSCGYRGHAPDGDRMCGVDLVPARPRVFCASLADWLDDEVPAAWLSDLLDLIRTTPHLDWLLLSKRPRNFFAQVENAGNFVSESNYDLWGWIGDWVVLGKAPANVWIGTTVEDQQRADERIPELLKIPARVRFLSCEPLLGPVNLNLRPDVMAGGYNALRPYRPQGCTSPFQPRIHWVIAGGESGPGARPMHPDWARSLRDQCQAAEVPFLFKQWGEWCPAVEAHGVTGHVLPESGIMPCGKRASWIGWDGKMACPSCTGLRDPIMAIARLGKKAAGRQLDGREWNEFPRMGSEVAA